MLKKLATDPKTQYNFNKFFFVFFLINVPVIVILEICFSRFWLQISATYIALGTVWGVVATHLAGMSAALSARDSKHVDSAVSDLTASVDDIRDTVLQADPAPQVVWGPQ